MPECWQLDSVARAGLVVGVPLLIPLLEVRLELEHANRGQRTGH
jgi:hypothetical protein